MSNADAMSQIANPVYWLHYIFGVRKFDFEKGREWYRQRFETNWQGLIQPAKDMISEKYEFGRRPMS